jgi:hypothetical protein
VKQTERRLLALVFEDSIRTVLLLNRDWMAAYEHPNAVIASQSVGEWINDEPRSNRESSDQNFAISR